MTTYLLPVMFEGAGTEHVEAQSSFITRLARRHCLSTGRFISMVVAWGERNGLQANCLRGDYGLRVLTFNGYYKTVYRFRELLNYGLCRNDVGTTSLQLFELVAAANAARALKSQRAWCPACWTEARRDGHVVYDKLIFQLLGNQRCQLHQIFLESNCWNCGARQHHYHGSGVIDRCCGCGESLTNSPPSRWRHETKPSLGEKDLIECIRFGVINPGYSYPSGNVRIFIENYLKHMSAPISSVENIFGQSLQFTRPLRNRDCPTISTLIRIALFSNVSLHSILAEPVAAALAARTEPMFSYDIDLHKSTDRTIQVAKRVRSLLENAISDPIFPATNSLSNLCREAGVSNGYIRYRFGPLASKLIKLRKEHRANQQKKLIEQVEMQINDVGIPAYLSGEWESHERVVDELHSRYGLSENQLRVALPRLIRRRGLKRWRDKHPQPTHLSHLSITRAVLLALGSSDTPMRAFEIASVLVANGFPRTLNLAINIYSALDSLRKKHYVTKLSRALWSAKSLIDDPFFGKFAKELKANVTKHSLSP